MESPGSTPLSFSKVPGSPSFRKAAVNAVALVPLLSSKDNGAEIASQSAASFTELLESLRAHSTAAPQVIAEDEVLLVVPNNSLTRPGDWRYNDTPLKAFHWQHGCQRLMLFDGRPQESRPAHDRLINQAVTRDWIDLCPSRRTAAVVGVLNLRDCESLADLHRAEEELHQWALRYATPPYEVTAHGRGGERDKPVERLFVFDSFDDECQKIDLTKSNMGSSILAFPPASEAHSQMMDLHLNVVVNDMAVAIFRSLEDRIQASDAVSRSKGEQTANSRTSLSRLMSGQSNDSDEPAASPTNLSLSSMATLVSPANKLAQETSLPGEKTFSKSSEESPVPARKTRNLSINSKSVSTKAGSEPQLMTPMDENWDYSQLSPRDVEALKKRDIGRREKQAADLSILAGSPLDAYERYLKAAELCKTSGTPDPLWYASALEGCAAAHIAMAEAGGYNVDEYLENNFQMPDEIMALAKREDDKRQSTLTPSKQTLPEVVFALCDEALNIFNRSEMLACFYAELLLKLALYSSESAEGHLRCRWGEGPNSFAGDQGSIPRWEKTSVSQLKFGELKTKDDRDMVEINTFNRVKKVCELLHEAVSIGNLDAASRVDVAARSARFCLEGVQASQWKRPNSERIKLLRKAAFFSVAAAEALTSVDGASAQTPENLWLISCQLCSRSPNQLGKEGSYAWATLRASLLHSLSLLGTSSVSREAAELLLSLLTEISPSIPKSSSKTVSGSKQASPGRKLLSRTSSAGTDTSGIQSIDSESRDLFLDTEEDDTAYPASTFANRVRATFTTMTASSSLLAVEAKWADEDVVIPVLLPLSSSPSTAKQVLSLGCVWQAIEYPSCSSAQKECIERIVSLRKSTSTASSAPHSTTDIYGMNFNTLPLYVSSAMAVEADSSLELSSLKKKNTPKAEGGAMSTFFNPFDKSKSKKATVTKVAGEEERAMIFRFGNSLAVPLRVSQCRLEFEGDIGDRVKSPTLAFDVPPKADTFAVRFPFTVVPPSGKDGEVEPDAFEVKGITLSCMNRSFFLPVAPSVKTLSSMSKELPQPASEYPHRSKKKQQKASVEVKPTLKLEVYPCQPNLKISFAESDAAVDIDTKLDMGLTAGQVIATPTFRLLNYSGPSGGGKIQRLQISAVGVPGSQEIALYDSDVHDATKSAEGSGDDFLRDLIEQENPPALKIRLVSVKSLSLQNINGSESSDTSPCRVAFQLAAAHNLGLKIPVKTTVTLRIKCAGQATATSDVWRTREIPINISYIKGPRIASISLSPDLVEGSGYAEMRRIISSRVPTRNIADSTEAEHLSIQTRVGLDTGVHICSESILAIFVVVNETLDDIILSRPNGVVGGFEGHPLETLLLHSNVTSRIPVIIPRLPRAEGLSDLIEAFVERTTFTWETAQAIKSTGHFARGRISIPPERLSDIFRATPSLGPNLCQAPCNITFTVDSRVVTRDTITVAPGHPMDLSVSAVIAPWVPLDVREKCCFTLELFSSLEGEKTTGQSPVRDHMWCGKVRHSFSGKESDGCMVHAAKIVLIQAGTHLLSACVRISQGDAEETWLTPLAAQVLVDPALLPSQ